MFNFFYSNSVFNNDNYLHLIPFHQKIAFNIETVNKFICMLYKSQLVYIPVKDDMHLLESNLESSIDQFQRYCYRYLLKCFGSKNNVFKLNKVVYFRFAPETQDSTANLSTVEVLLSNHQSEGPGLDFRYFLELFGYGWICLMYFCRL